MKTLKRYEPQLTYWGVQGWYVHQSWWIDARDYYERHIEKLERAVDELRELKNNIAKYHPLLAEHWEKIYNINTNNELKEIILEKTLNDS